MAIVSSFSTRAVSGCSSRLHRRIDAEVAVEQAALSLDGDQARLHLQRLFSPAVGAAAAPF